MLTHRKFYSWNGALRFAPLSRGSAVGAWVPRAPGWLSLLLILAACLLDLEWNSGRETHQIFPITLPQRAASKGAGFHSAEERQSLIIMVKFGQQRAPKAGMNISKLSWNLPVRLSSCCCIYTKQRTGGELIAFQGSVMVSLPTTAEPGTEAPILIFLQLEWVWSLWFSTFLPTPGKHWCLMSDSSSGILLFFTN